MGIPRQLERFRTPRNREITMIKILAFSVLFMACQKEVVKKEFVKPEQVSGYSCSYSEEVTAKLFEDAIFKTGHSFCFQPGKEFAQVSKSCQEEGGFVGVVCPLNPTVTCHSDEGDTLFYGPNWTEASCP